MDKANVFPDTGKALTCVC